jgi:hypothetical protein
MTTKHPVDLDQLRADVYDLTRRYNEGRSHTVGLVIRLLNTAERVLATSGQSERVSSGKPGSRPPSRASDQAADLVAHIEAGVWEHDADLRDALNAHLSYDRPFLTALDHLPDLAGRLPNAASHDLTRRLERAIRSWRNACRVQLGYAAPMTTLQNPCPLCGQRSLIVRADAGSDVICTTDGCLDDTGRPPRWDRYTWTQLLTDSTRESA